MGGSCEKSLPEPGRIEAGRAQILRESADGPVLWALGAECGTAEKVAEILLNSGIGSTLINARFAAPFDRSTAEKFASRLQVAIEDHASGGIASALAESLSSCPGSRVLAFNWRSGVVGHGNISELRKRAGLDPESIAAKIESFF